MRHRAIESFHLDAVVRRSELLLARSRGWNPTFPGPHTRPGDAEASTVVALAVLALYALLAPHDTGVRDNGDLLWTRHNGRVDGSSAWTGPKTVGTAWNFKHVFPGGDGIVYAVKDNGDLLWYRHNGRLDGTSAWARPKTVGTGWSGFSRVVGVEPQE